MTLSFDEAIELLQQMSRAKAEAKLDANSSHGKNQKLQQLMMVMVNKVRELPEGEDYDGELCSMIFSVFEFGFIVAEMMYKPVNQSSNRVKRKEPR